MFNYSYCTLNFSYEQRGVPGNLDLQKRQSGNNDMNNVGTRNTHTHKSSKLGSIIHVSNRYLDV